METHKDARPYLLSKAQEFNLVGTKEEIETNRTSNSVRDHCCYISRVTTNLSGSEGDGFNHKLCSDVDVMLINNDMIAMYPDMYQGVTSSHRGKPILLIREAGCRPGYVHLELINIHQTIPKQCVHAAVPVLNSKFISSDLYREYTVQLCKGLGFGYVSSVGPSSKIHIQREGTINPCDFVMGIPCICWPKDADEWSFRLRVYGWPNEALVKQIINKGCHLVPVGDKCSDDTFLQWRFSFATAEKQLIHSLNYIQFKVYGLLKYILKQIKYRVKQDIGDDDILCSYFIKTLILYSVENSPQSLWQEKNIFVCFSFCFTTLLDWINSGYCPNYFIPANNMFQRKVHGASKMKLLNILCELHQMKWGILSIGNAYKPSMWELLQTSQMEMIYRQTPSEIECRKDRAIGSFGLSKGTLSKSLFKMSKMLLKSKTDVQEIISYLALVDIITVDAIKQYEESKDRHGNKVRYSSMMKCKRLLTLSFGSNLLHLATFYYKTGNYRKAIELCENCSKLVKKDDPEYRAVYCGRGTSTFNKLKQAHRDNLYFLKSASEICLSELLPELHSSNFSFLKLHPNDYCILLLFLSHFSLGDFFRYRAVLHFMECTRSFKGRWIFHTFTGICYQKLGDYQLAIQAYQDSHRTTPKFTINPALERIKALQSKIMT